MFPDDAEERHNCHEPLQANDIRSYLYWMPTCNFSRLCELNLHVYDTFSLAIDGTKPYVFSQTDSPYDHAWA